MLIMFTSSQDLFHAITFKFYHIFIKIFIIYMFKNCPKNGEMILHYDVNKHIKIELSDSIISSVIP